MCFLVVLSVLFLSFSHAEIPQKCLMSPNCPKFLHVKFYHHHSKTLFLARFLSESSRSDIILFFPLISSLWANSNVFTAEEIEAGVNHLTPHSCSCIQHNHGWSFNTAPFLALTLHRSIPLNKLKNCWSLFSTYLVPSVHFVLDSKFQRLLPSGCNLASIVILISTLSFSFLLPAFHAAHVVTAPRPCHLQPTCIHCCFSWPWTWLWSYFLFWLQSKLWLLI